MRSIKNHEKNLILQKSWLFLSPVDSYLENEMKMKFILPIKSRVIFPAWLLLMTFQWHLWRTSDNLWGLKELLPGILSLSYRIVILQSTIQLLHEKLFHERTIHGPTPSSKSRVFEDAAYPHPYPSFPNGISRINWSQRVGSFGKILLVGPEYTLLPLLRGWNYADF